MRKRQYKVNDDYFKEWSHNMAYILGLWFSDGHIDTKVNVFSICQHKKDKYLLEMVLKEMKSDSRLTKSRNVVVFRITSKSIVRDIVSLGGKPNKSLDVKFPNIPKKYLPDFIRGLWDGDGCISNQKHRGYNYYRASISSGSKDFIYALKVVLNENIPLSKGFIETKVQKRGTFIKGKSLKNNSVVYQFNFGINDTRRLREFMYYDKSCDLKMIRKYKKFKEAGDIRFHKPIIIRAYMEAKRYVQDKLIVQFKINTKHKWIEYAKSGKKPKFIPADPFRSYKNKGWVDWYDWLGKERPKTKIKL